MTVLPVVIGSLYRLLVPRSVTWQKFYWGCSCRKEFVRVQESQTGPAYSRTGCTRVKYRRATNVLPKLQGIGPLVDASKCKPYKIHDVGVCHDVESRIETIVHSLITGPWKLKSRSKSSFGLKSAAVKLLKQGSVILTRFVSLTRTGNLLRDRDVILAPLFSRHFNEPA